MLSFDIQHELSIAYASELGKVKKGNRISALIQGQKAKRNRLHYLCMPYLMGKNDGFGKNNISHEFGVGALLK